MTLQKITVLRCGLVGGILAGLTPNILMAMMLKNPFFIPDDRGITFVLSVLLASTYIPGWTKKTGSKHANK